MVDEVRFVGTMHNEDLEARKWIEDTYNKLDARLIILKERFNSMSKELTQLKKKV